MSSTSMNGSVTFPAGKATNFATNLADLFGVVLDGRNAHLADGVEQALAGRREFSDFAGGR